MFTGVVMVTIGVLLAIVVIVFGLHWAWGKHEQGQVWKDLNAARVLPPNYCQREDDSFVVSKVVLPPGIAISVPLEALLTDGSGPAERAGKTVTLRADREVSMVLTEPMPARVSEILWVPPEKQGLGAKIEGLAAGSIVAFSWAQEESHWAREAETIRRSFLSRTQATAEKWRNIFTALLAVFGAVVLIKPSFPTSGGLETEIYACVLGALVMAVQAVAYTGWAAAGLPKRLVNVSAATAFYEQTNHATRSLIRLRVGLICGAIAAVALILAVAGLLSTGMS